MFEAVYQQALKSNLDEDPQVKRKLQRLQRRMIIEEFLAREVGSNIETEPDGICESHLRFTVFGLPDAAAREAIFGIHLGRHRIAATDAERTTLATASEGFAGAEIEAAVLAARYEAHALGQAASAEHVRNELARTRPLSVTRAEALSALRAWANGRTVGAD